MERLRHLTPESSVARIFLFTTGRPRSGNSRLLPLPTSICGVQPAMPDPTFTALVAAWRTVTIALVLFIGALAIAPYWDQHVFFSALRPVSYTHLRAHE